jgi:hypothetical protein
MFAHTREISSTTMAYEAQLAGGLEQVSRELARLVDESGPGADHFFGEAADGVPEKRLLLGELQIHATGEYIGRAGGPAGGGRAGGRKSYRTDNSSRNSRTAST